MIVICLERLLMVNAVFAATIAWETVEMRTSVIPPWGAVAVAMVVCGR